MPAAIPLAAAAFSVGAGIAAGATTIAGGLMIAGGAITAIGSLTGNKKLAMIGGVMSLGGGAVGAFSSMGGAAAGAAGAVEGGSAAAGMDGALVAMDTANAAAAAGGGLADTAMSAAQYADMAGGLIPQAGGPSSAAAPAWASAGSVDAAAAAPGGVPPVNAGVRPPAPAPTLPSGTDPGLLTKFQDWVKANPELAKQASGLIGGAAKSYGDQVTEQESWKNRMRYQDWIRQRYSDSVRNLTVPTYQRQAGGILAGQRG